MTKPADHLDDELLSAFVDDQLARGERAAVQSHLATCAACAERVDDFRSVAALLRRLSDVEPPRDLSLGPRLVRDPPNVIRLRRVYVVARAAAASLAAVFVVLSLGTLYVDTRPQPTTSVAASKPEFAAAPSATTAPAAAKAAAPALAQSPAAASGRSGQPPPGALSIPPAAGSGAAAVPRSDANAQPDDQHAAATSVSPLPTLPPTPFPTAVPAPVVAPMTGRAVDSAGPLRNAAIAVGVLAVITLLATLVVRHRLQRVAPR